MSSNQKSERNVNQQNPNPPGSAALDERLQAHIGTQLKSMYDSFLTEPIPDRLVELLQELDRVSEKKAARGESKE
ncbi:NepR family anti-sigma factor [Microbaculum marinum]|uniref:NepR family anti-sigma factor n=1 Tax=Microbaculum marinum TaxID=1764581 RepID=A0AAW9RDT5_9HYPH